MTAAAHPRVSVLVPTYNRVAFLPEALESVLAQDLDDAEIVISDNASTDGTWDVCQDLARRDPRIRLTRNERNLGLAGNFDRLLHEARGDYVKLMMSDDLLYPGAVTKLVEPLDANPRIVLATAEWELVSPSGQRLAASDDFTLPLTGSEFDGIALGDRMLRDTMNYVGNPTSVIFRRSAFDGASVARFGRHRIRLAVDMGLWLRLLARGRVSFRRETLSAYRVHSDQVGGTAAERIAGLQIEWRSFLVVAAGMSYLAEPADRRAATTRLLEGARETLRRLDDGTLPVDERRAARVRRSLTRLIRRLRRDVRRLA